MQSQDYGDSQIAWNIYRAFSKKLLFFFWGGGGEGVIWVVGRENSSQPPREFCGHAPPENILKFSCLGLLLVASQTHACESCLCVI